MNDTPARRKRSPLVLALAILAFASAFFVRANFRSVQTYALWRDGPVLTVICLALSVVLLGVWLRGSGGKAP